MLQNIRRALVSFVGVGLAFGVYMLCVVPLVEPRDALVTDAETPKSDATNDSAGNNTNSTDRFVRELVDLGFPPTSWELNNPRVLRVQQATILLKELNELPDGSLEITPCTLVFYGSDRERTDAQRGPTIMQAPEGAILAFDKPIKLQELDFGGKLIGGQLMGGIRIFSSGGRDGEDLTIETSNVRITDQRILTREKVAFWLGKSHGVGQDLTLTRAERKIGGLGPAPAKTSIASGDWLSELGLIELQKLERLTLQLPDDGVFSSFGDSSKPTNTARSQQSRDGQQANKPAVQVNVNCDGPLRLDLQYMIATVEENVKISRQLPEKPADTLHASQLSMHLTRRARDQRIDSQKGMVPQKVSLSRIVAVGSPLVIDARSQHAYVETRRMEYDFDSKRIKLRGDGEANAPTSRDEHGRVLIRNQTHEISAPAIDYLHTKDRSQMQLIAQGPGQYVGAVDTGTGANAAPGTAPQQIAASWRKRLSLQPVDSQQLLKVEGKASVRAPGLGAIHSDNIDLWVRQSEPIATRLDGTPVRKIVPTKLATYSASSRRTTIASSRISGTLSKMTILFESGLPPSQQPEAQRAAASPSNRFDTPADSKPRSFHIDGGELTAWMDLDNRELQRIFINGDSRIREKTSANSQNPPFEVAGSSIDFRTDNEGRPMARLLGSPAELATADMRLRGADIQLRGDENRIYIPGEGTLRMKYQPDALTQELRPSAPNHKKDAHQPKPSEEIELEWKNGLLFDGQVATLEGDVAAIGRDLAVRTADLEVILDRRVDLSKLSEKQQPPKIAMLTAQQGVLAGGRQRKPDGTVESYQQIATQDLNVDFRTGAFVANGPGWIAVTTTGDKLPSLTRTTKPSPKATPPTNSALLQQLSLSFNRQLVGNMLQREVRLDDNVQGWLGPVTSWEDRVDPLRVTELGEDQIRLSCRRLTVIESPTAAPLDPSKPNSRKPIELLADGGAHVEGQLYFARGNQITFVEEKGVLTLKGDDQRLAEFWQRNSAKEQGSLSGKARRIQYMVETGEMEGQLSNVSVDVSALPDRRQ